MGSYRHLTVHKDTKIAGNRFRFDLDRTATPRWAAPDELCLASVQLQWMTLHPQANILNAAQQLVW